MYSLIEKKHLYIKLLYSESQFRSMLSHEMTFEFCGVPVHLRFIFFKLQHSGLPCCDHPSLGGVLRFLGILIKSTKSSPPKIYLHWITMSQAGEGSKLYECLCWVWPWESEAYIQAIMGNPWRVTSFVCSPWPWIRGRNYRLSLQDIPRIYVYPKPRQAQDLNDLLTCTSQHFASSTCTLLLLEGL